MILVMHIKKKSVPDRKKINADSCLTRQNPPSPPIFVSRKNKKKNVFGHHCISTQLYVTWVFLLNCE